MTPLPRKRGRPKLDDAKETIAFRVSVTDYDYACALASREGLELAAVARRLFAAGCDANRLPSGNSRYTK